MRRPLENLKNLCDVSKIKIAKFVKDLGEAKTHFKIIRFWILFCFYFSHYILKGRRKQKFAIFFAASFSSVTIELFIIRRWYVKLTHHHHYFLKLYLNSSLILKYKCTKILCFPSRSSKSAVHFYGFWLQSIFRHPINRHFL